MLGLGSILTKSSTLGTLVTRLITQHLKFEREDDAEGENPNGLVAPLKFLTQNPPGG